MSEVAIDPQQNLETVRAGVGDHVLISLPERPSSGFRWEITEISGTSLMASGDDFFLLPHTGMGGGGTRTFRFFAPEPGDTHLVMELKRVWERKLPQENDLV